MKTNLKRKISTIDEAKLFLNELIINNEIYHPEDDAHDIIWNLPENQKPTNQECNQLNYLMDEIFELDDFDPCGFIIDNGFGNEFCECGSDFTDVYFVDDDVMDELPKHHYRCNKCNNVKQIG